MLGVWLYLRSAKVPVHNVQFSAFYVRLDFVQVGASLVSSVVYKVPLKANLEHLLP